ncbi:MAG: hypothetical protein WEF50_18300 [Myxococcota bacterium]
MDVLFEKSSPIRFRVQVRDAPGASNATYSRLERARNQNFRVSDRLQGVLDDATHVLMEARIHVGAAGGNAYQVSATDANGNEVVAPKDVETRRKLYYQVIKMRGMRLNVGTLTNHIKTEFWNSGRKHYLQLKEIVSLGDIAGFANFDTHTQGQISTLARARYSRDRDPFCIAIVLTDHMAASETATLRSGLFTVPPGGMPNVVVGLGTTTAPHVGSTRYLWQRLDTAGTPDDFWWVSGGFQPVGGGAPTPITQAMVTPAGATHTTQVSVDASGLAAGWRGRAVLELKMVNRFRTGLSLANNAVCVASRATWQNRPESQMKSTLVHELGHKVGMVPGRRDEHGSATNAQLAQQSTYYPLMGGHCNHGTNICVMFGSIHAGRQDVFCAICSPNVRRLDMDASSAPGFAPI